MTVSDDKAAAADGPRQESVGAGDGARAALVKAWQVLRPLMDLATPMALRVAATLRLADVLPANGDGMPVGELAGHAGADPDALARMLRHLVCHGVFTEPHPGVFAVNDTAALLRSDHPAGAWIRLDLDGYGGRMDLAFTGLLHTVRTGEPAWETVFGQPFWQYLGTHPAIGASFDQTMETGAVGAALRAAVADAYDWTTARHVADVGGGTGVLIAEVLGRDPALRGTLVDLPETAARARDHLAGAGVGDRCEIVGRSFFDPLPAGADIYLLSGVIHNWDDERAALILRRCAEAAGRGRVLIIEYHGTPEKDAATFGEANLRMLVLMGGCERTIDDYTALAHRAGLRVAAVHPTASLPVIIECVPA